MDEIDRLEAELLAAMRELLIRDSNAVVRVMKCLEQASVPIVWPKLKIAG